MSYVLGLAWAGVEKSTEQKSSTSLPEIYD